MKIYRGQRKNRSKDSQLKRLAIYGAVVVVIIIIFIIWGVTLLANLSTFWDSTRGSNISASPSGSRSATLSPTISSSVSKTNKSKVDITGQGQPGSVVTLYRSFKEIDSQVVGNDGQFKFSAESLRQGLNSFTAKTKVGGADPSPDSNTLLITLDTTPPKLTVTEPADGAVRTTSYTTVAGQTDAGASVTINDQQQIVQADGSFSGLATLQSGANTITVVATDDAGNRSTTTLTVTYTP